MSNSNKKLRAAVYLRKSSIDNRIGEREETVVVMQRSNKGADSAVLARLDNLEQQIAGIGPIDTEDIEEDVLDIES
jgi:predicted RND superfamily exporter protein